MPDANPPAPAPMPAPMPGPGPDEYDQAQLATVKNGEALARSAQKAAYAPTLATEGLNAPTPERLLEAAGRWRDLSRRAVEATQQAAHGAGAGGEARTALARQIEYFRSKARLHLSQHPELTPADVRAFKARYYFGENVLADAERGAQKAADVFRHGAEDALPALTPTRTAAAEAALADYAREDADARTAATTLREQRDREFEAIMRLRHEIQHAADAGWPWWEDVNIGIRREFQLPLGRPFTATD